MPSSLEKIRFHSTRRLVLRESDVARRGAGWHLWFPERDVSFAFALRRCCPVVSLALGLARAGYDSFWRGDMPGGLEPECEPMTVARFALDADQLAGDGFDLLHAAVADDRGPTHGKGRQPVSKNAR